MTSLGVRAYLNKNRVNDLLELYTAYSFQTLINMCQDVLLI